MNTTVSAPARTPLSRRDMLVLACSVGLVPLNSTMIAVAIPAIGRDLAAEPSALIQWLVSSYLLINIIALSPAGKMGDRWGHARVLALGQGLFAVGSVLGFLASALPLLVAARVLMALGGAMIVPAAMALARVRLPEDQRVRAFGMFGAVMGLSAAIGPLAGGEIAARFGWTALFLVNIVPLTIAAALSLGRGSTLAQAPVLRASSRFDLMGSALLGAGLGLIVTGARSDTWWLPMVATGVGLLLGFAWWERRAADPVVNLALFKRRAFAAGSLIIGLQNFAMYALLFELPVVFSSVFGASSAQSGRALIALTMAMVIGSVVGGSVAGKFGTRRAALVGTAVALSGGLLMALGTLKSVSGAVPALMALGLGLGFTTPAANAALMAVAKPSESGMASGVSSTVRYLGGIAGVATVSAMVANESLLAAHQHSAILFAIALAVALALAWLIPGHKPVAAEGAGPGPASASSGSKTETTRG